MTSVVKYLYMQGVVSVLQSCVFKRSDPALVCGYALIIVSVKIHPDKRIRDSIIKDRRAYLYTSASRRQNISAFIIRLDLNTVAKYTSYAEYRSSREIIHRRCIDDRNSGLPRNIKIALVINTAVAV